MEFFTISMLNGLSYGLLLFMLSSGLTLIFSMMGVLNFAHASFYMVGAYIAYSIARVIGFWPALLIAPLVVGGLGALFERYSLRRVHKFGHVPELLITFGLAFVVTELVQLIWGRTAVEFLPPESLRGPAFTIINSSVDGLHVLWGAAPAAMCSAADAAVRIVCSPFPATRAFMMLVALAMLVSLWLLLTRTRIGLVIQSALTHPQMVEALGHNVPRIFMLVFGAGSALAGLAGVIGGTTFVTEPTPNTSMKIRGTLWPSASTICGCVSALWMTSPILVRVSSSHSDTSIARATSIMKPRVAGNGEQTMRTAASAAEHIAAGAAPQRTCRPSTEELMMVKAGPRSDSGGRNSTAVRPQMSCTSSVTTNASPKVMSSSGTCPNLCTRRRL